MDGRGGRVHYSIKRDSKENPAGDVQGIHSPGYYYSLENMEFSVLHNFCLSIFQMSFLENCRSVGLWDDTSPLPLILGYTYIALLKFLVSVKKKKVLASVSLLGFYENKITDCKVW